MSKIKCVHCGKTINSSSKVCIYCRKKVGSLPDAVIEERVNKFFKYIFIISISFIIIITVYSIAMNIKKNYVKTKKINNLIQTICSTNSYKKNKKLVDILSDNDCGSFVYYFFDKEVSSYEFDKILDNDDDYFFKLYHKVTQKNLHENLEKTEKLTKNYLKYLSDNKFKLSNDIANEGLNNSFKNNDKELFELYSKLTSNPNEMDIYYYFNYGTLEKYTYNSEETEESRKQRFNNAICASEFSLIYHKNTSNKFCLTADILDYNNLKYLIEYNNKYGNEYINKGRVCALNLESNKKYLVKENFDNYIKAGGKYSDYAAGNFYRDVIDYDHVYYDKGLFEEYIKLYSSVNVDINTKTDVYTACGNECTALDYLIYEEKSNCVSYKNGFGSIDEQYKISCEKAMKKYKILKKYGAKCNVECSNEKWFK